MNEYEHELASRLHDARLAEIYLAEDIGLLRSLCGGGQDSNQFKEGSAQ